MIKRIFIILTILVLILVSTTPAMADKPVGNQGKSTSAHGANPNAHNGNPAGNAPHAVNPDLPAGSAGNPAADKTGFSSGASTQGFDDAGYNRTARIFNGTAWSWCMDKVGDEAWCDAYLGPNKWDKIIMKWNAEWDRGNAEGWSKAPYDAWENNQWNGNVPGGSGDVWHYKIVWVGDCVADPSLIPAGGYCIWGQFAVIMDQGTLDGVHYWFAHGKPAGYGSYP